MYFPLLSLTMLVLASFSTGAVAQPQNCSNYVFSGNNQRFATCSSLPVLNSFLHWNYYASNNTVDLAYRHTGVTATNWVAWSLNLGGGRMIGAQCLVAFQNSSGLVHAYTSPVNSYSTTMQEGPLSFPVPRIGAEYSNNQIIIYATIKLPTGKTSFTHVWQHGPVSGGVTLQVHSTTGDNVRSFGTIDFANGNTTAGGGGGGGDSESGESGDSNGASDRESSNDGGTSNTGSGASSACGKTVHGMLNLVSWGILMRLLI